MASGVLLIVLPGLVNLLGDSTSSRVVDALGFEGTSWRLQRLMLGFAGTAAAIAVGAVAVWLQQRRQLRLLRGALAGIAGGAILLIPFTLATETAAVRGWSSSRDTLVLLAACAVIVLFAVFAHNRRYSMHLFYRERIQEAFASERAETEHGLDVVSIMNDEAIRLSDVATRNAAQEGVPELVMCAAVAARGEEVPSKTWAASFTFEGRWPGNGRLGLQAPTTEIEGGTGLVAAG